MDSYERLLDRAKAAHGSAEVFGVKSERRHVEFEANRPKNIGQSQSSGVALRIINTNGQDRLLIHERCRQDRRPRRPRRGAR